MIGGSGFFGKSILDCYRRGLLAPWKIDRIDVVARTASNLMISNPELMSETVFLHDLDITNCTQLPTAHYVIHAAASTDINNYLSRPAKEKKNIQLGTSHFCHLASQFFVDSKILYVSSGAVYGQQSENTSHIAEDDDFQVIGTLDKGKQDYAAAKRDGESYIRELGDKGLRVAIARCFAFVGPYLPRDQHFAIGNFIEDGLRSRAITVKAQNPVYRSYLFADDLVIWLMTILEQSSAQCPVVNVGSEEAILMGDLAEMVAQFFGVQADIPQLTGMSVNRYVPSIDKALELGCPKPLKLSDALVATIKAINSYNHLDGYP